MKDLNSRAHDLFLLMFNLSQLTLKEKIIEVFMEALREIWPDIIVLYKETTSGKEEKIIDISAGYSNYGYVVIGNFPVLANEDKDLLGNAVAMLAIILKKNEQDKLLSDEKLHLQQLVNEKIIAFKESEEKFRNVFNNSTIGLSITTIDGKLKTNKAFRDILGYSETELSKLKWQKITHPDDLERNKKIVDSIISGEKSSARWEKRYIHKKGNIIWVDITTALQRDGEGKPLYFITSTNDITNRILAEVSLCESEERFSKIFRASPIAISIARVSDGKLTDVNEAWCNLMGFSREEAIGYNVEELKIIDVEYRNKLREEFLNTGSLCLVDNEIITKSGIKKSILTSAEIIALKGDRFSINLVIDITERKQAEKAIAESKEKLRLALEGAVADSWDMNLATGELFYGDQWARHLGYQPGEIPYTIDGTIGILHPDDVLNNQKELEAYLSGKKPIYEAETRIRRKDGTYAWLLSRGKIIERDKAGNPVRLIGTNIDTTERKQAEKTFHQSEEKFRTLFMSMSEGFYLSEIVYDNNGNPCDYRYLEVNPKFEQIMGLSRDQIIGKRYKELVPVDTTQWLDNYCKVARTGGPLVYEFYSKEYQKYFETHSYQSTKDQVIVFVLDITQRKAADVEIQRQTNELKALHLLSSEISRTLSLDEVISIAVEGILNAVHPDLVFYFIRSENILILKKAGPQSAMKRFAGIPELKVGECICGLAASENKPLFSKDIFADLRCSWDACKKAGFRSFAALPVCKSNEVIGVVGLASDEPRDFASQSEFLETLVNQIALNIQNAMLHEEVISHSAELELRVKQRTVQLEAANKELETFTYSVSHDLKAPLRGIDGYSKLLQDLYATSLNAEAQTFIATIRSSTLQMNQLIEDLLEYSRLERGHMRTKTIKIRDIISSITSFFNEELNTGKFVIHIKVPDIEVVADPKGLTIALRNLIDNAIKFTREKPKPAIEIKLEENASSWILSVKDNGIGFEMQYQKKIFEIFQRLHRVEDFPGTGIGLTMVNKIMQRMQGNVWAESLPGVGSTFYLELPKFT